jgi:eukaryotic-like serine/threonine-protein kinase
MRPRFGGAAGHATLKRIVREADPLVGTLVADRYRVGRKLGEGGMGLVYLATHESLRKPVALKVLATSARAPSEAIARFEREAIAAGNLRHPNIAEATDFGQLPDGGLYLVMEYVEGTTLRKLLAKERLAPERALAIVQQIGAALAAAHGRDIVHRDLKPENVIVTRGASGGDVVKVIDFGIAKLRSTTFDGIGTGLTSAGTVFGTPEYMSPEQVMGQPVDARADQYALGVLAFELLTGKAPYKNDDVGQLMMMHVGAPIPSARGETPKLSPGIDAAITRMLAKLPDERFSSIADAMNALMPVKRPLLSRKHLGIAGAVLLLVALVGLLVHAVAPSEVTRAPRPVSHLRADEPLPRPLDDPPEPPDPPPDRGKAKGKGKKK